MSYQEIREYICTWCKYKFITKAGVTGGQYNEKTGSRSARISSQVKCPRCGNFLKTWEDGKKIKTVQQDKGQNWKEELEKCLVHTADANT